MTITPTLRIRSRLTTTAAIQKGMTLEIGQGQEAEVMRSLPPRGRERAQPESVCRRRAM